MVGGYVYPTRARIHTRTHLLHVRRSHTLSHSSNVGECVLAVFKRARVHIRTHSSNGRRSYGLSHAFSHARTHRTPPRLRLEKEEQERLEAEAREAERKRKEDEDERCVWLVWMRTVIGALSLYRTHLTYLNVRKDVLNNAYAFAHAHTRRTVGALTHDHTFLTSLSVGWLYAITRTHSRTHALIEHPPRLRLKKEEQERLEAEARDAERKRKEEEEERCVDAHEL